MRCGRKQYRYHPDWTRARDEAKFDRFIAFGKALPRLRRTIGRHMDERGLGRRKVLATVAHLLDTTLVRVGNQEYARDNKSYGLTTLQDRHVTFSGPELRFCFRGKAGQEWKLKRATVASRAPSARAKSPKERPRLMPSKRSSNSYRTGLQALHLRNGCHRRISVRHAYVVKNKLAVPDRLKAFSERMRTRPTVHIALKHEGLI